MNGWTLRVAEHIAAYKIQSLENFPPAFKLIDPDKSYDEQILKLKLKKMKSYVLTWGIFEGMLRCFIGPGTQKALQVQLASSDMVPNPLADEHRHTLADACLKTVELMLDLYEKMGGGQTSFWAAPAAMSENGKLLGHCLISDDVNRRFGNRDDEIFGGFEDGVLKLEKGSRTSSRQHHAMDKILPRILATRMDRGLLQDAGAGSGFGRMGDDSHVSVILVESSHEDYEPEDFMGDGLQDSL
ncbi:uncharacterized protein RSE6_11885 [Rhynchosporium secalis]|uniref:Uncharacterized protein n=1 Tax=Rhynchosporium secalis TaxID=38038 RepID=A0A1E1MQ03_RHYSE|nr:uncharacterized protein RSE6_11885 [Rhynchosporium secalis]